MNTVVIFDWDDTLLCTDVINNLKKDGYSISSIKNVVNHDISKSAGNLLKEALKYSIVYIITNAQPGWIEYSVENFVPNLKKIISLCKIKYACEYIPKGVQMTKSVIYHRVISKHKSNNCIAFTDSINDRRDFKNTCKIISEEKNINGKHIKFAERPLIKHLITQQNLVKDNFRFIVNSDSNLDLMLNITITQKKEKPKSL